jgi:alkaline phosphatase D
VICGDSHNGWAFDLTRTASPRASSSPATASLRRLRIARRRSEASSPQGWSKANPELKWCDTSRRGYMALTLTPERASNDWVFVDTVRTRKTRRARGPHRHGGRAGGT